MNRSPRSDTASRVVHALYAAALAFLVAAAPPVRGDESNGYVGADACRSCHDDAYVRWSSSHHAQSMRLPTPSSVLGNFDDARFVENGVETRFFKRGSGYYVRTQGADGKPQEYAVKYTFGFDPLQQYLLELPGGRLQALTIAWDSRPKAEGGQRWLSLYPDEKLAPGDPLHWTGYLQNWNLQCAHCHSVDLRKRYNVDTATYDTRFAEVNVACESCHGVGKPHVEWAKTATPPYEPSDAKGLTTRLGRRPIGSWRFADDTAAIATRVGPADDHVVPTCAPCHSRRTLLKEGVTPDASLFEGYRPALPNEPLYFVDGQQRDEVYTWGSFLQSKMYARGVVCSDCHDSHTLALRAEGNAVCAQCHRPDVFDTTRHHHHTVDGKGSHCVDCHMPPRTYMVVDPRHDHAFKVPRPDIASAVGAPDACTQCHGDKTQDWAAAEMDRFYGRGWRDRPQIATKVHSALRRGAVGARALLEIANDAPQPAIVRAAAVESAGGGFAPQQIALAAPLLRDHDPAVRLAALPLFERLSPEQALPLVAPLLTDAVGAVRSQAAVVLVGVPTERLGRDQLAARDRGIQDYVDAQLLNADQPFANVNLGNLYFRLGRIDDARVAIERALAIDPQYVPAYANLADLHRAAGDEAACDAAIARGLAAVPHAAALHHARGLALVRRGVAAEALPELETAAKLDPSSARYAYVHAVALHSLGRSSEALAALARADGAHPYDIEILSALVSLLLEARRPADALAYAQRLREALPEDPEIARLVARLEDDIR